jgi:hypothetical protein
VAIPQVPRPPRRWPRLSLQKFALEATALRQIFENTSKTGSVTINLPPLAESGSTLLVTLKPEEDVVLGLAKFTQAMLIERQTSHRMNGRRRAGIDPGSVGDRASDAVGETNSILATHAGIPCSTGTIERLMIAQELGLATGFNQAPCTGREGPGSGGVDDVSWTPQRYVAESITSDTEFLVNNA